MRYLSALSIYYRAIIRDALRQFGRKKNEQLKIYVSEQTMTECHEDGNVVEKSFLSVLNQGRPFLPFNSNIVLILIL